MAPLGQALSPQLVSSSNSGLPKHVYQGTVDPGWVVGSVPHGGYVLGLLVTASMKSQQQTKHKDPIHVTAHFMHPTARSEYTIEIEVVRTGSRFSNLTANLIQDGETKVLTHMIFGTLPEFDAPPSTIEYQDIPPSHPLSRPLPLTVHPSAGKLSPMHMKYGAFRNNVRRTEDSGIMAKNQAKLVAPPSSHEGGIESGSWWELAGEDEELHPAMIPFFADVAENMPAMLSIMHTGSAPMMWFPTMVMTLEFKRQLPRRGTPGFSDRTLGVYSRGVFLDHGRHDMYAEIWSAPSCIGQADGRDPNDNSWKKEMRCIAVAGQMALSVSLEVNRSKGEKKPAKAKL